MIKGLDDFVELEPISHKYHDKKGREYLSVSKFLTLFKPVFDRENISRAVARKRGVSQEVILAEWDETKDDSINHGNQIHNALERYEKSTIILPGDEHLRPMILSVAKEYSHYHKNHLEQVLYNETFGLAGTTDRLSETTSHKTSIVDFSDYKTNKSKGIQFKNDYGKYMLGPLSHLQDCNYNHYVLQLSIYAWMFQQLTGRNIGSLHLRFFPPHNLLAHYPIPVPYMKYEVEAMLDYKMKNNL